ncbi:uncharacterized protein LOC133799725 [Humulus lupulus]|uniref:uncharacterized protein LOC133799725 n=1 Tax=Humulus lupulus TaxID=3486 RepID=UPI002B418690|nr:uncharacterized protein LOC133799725 [Humulus lupulus]
MDKSWITRDMLSKEYEEGVDNFIKLTLENSTDLSRVHCPCRKCSNLKKLDIMEIKSHLYFNGMDQTYVKWIWHGEEDESNNNVPNERKQFDQVFDDPIEMVRDADERFVDKPKEFLKFLEDAEKPIFSGAPLSKLVVLVKLYNLKVGSSWSDTSFTKLLTLLKESLRKDNELPSSLYEAKKTLCTLGMEYSKIHACPNDCVLYRNQYESATKCPVYTFVSKSEHAKSLRWNEDGRIKVDKFRHPADSPTWKEVDELWPQIRKDPRNHRLGLSANGINPLSNMSSSYRCLICGEKTSATRLEHCRKMCYMGHRRFLLEKNYYRKQKLAFNGEQELREAPTPMTREAVYEEIRLIENKFGKPVEKVDESVETKGKKKGKCKTNIKRKRNKKDQLAEDSKNNTCWKKSKFSLNWNIGDIC